MSKTSNKAAAGTNKGTAKTQGSNKAAQTAAPVTSNGNSGNATESGKTETPAAAPVAVVAKVSKKQPPLKTGKRSGGAGSRSTKATLNFGMASYNDITNYVRHIVNGNYRPMFNGAEGTEIDEKLPVFKTAKEAFKAGAVIEFGFVNGEGKIASYVQNQHLEDGQKTNKPEQKYHCYLTATSAENAIKAIENLNAYYAMPWNKDTKEMVTLLPKFTPTRPSEVLAEVENPLYVAPVETPATETKETVEA